MKKVVKVLITLIVMIVLPVMVNAKDGEPITVHVFKGEGCGYCQSALEFLTSLKETEYGKYFDVVTYEVWYDDDNATLMKNVADLFGEEVEGVPYIIIGKKTFRGYATSYDEDIKKAIKESYDNEYYRDMVEVAKTKAEQRAKIKAEEAEDDDDDEDIDEEDDDNYIEEDEEDFDDDDFDDDDFDDEKSKKDKDLKETIIIVAGISLVVISICTYAIVKALKNSNRNNK